MVSLRLARSGGVVVVVPVWVVYGGAFMEPNVDPLRGLCGGGGRGRAAQAVKKCIRNPELRTKVDP